MLKTPNYSLRNYFITPNAYLCVELNAHSLILLIISLRESKNDSCFLPWLLGSQSCEKAFRTVRSMSSVFSTMINFSTLGLLRRLHRMHIQMVLEAEGDENKIHFPRIEHHKSKDAYGQKKDIKKHILADITDDLIAEAVVHGKHRAQAAMEILGMKNTLEIAGSLQCLLILILR